MGTDSIIYIRTDGNSQIATGHLVRCLSIAHALQKMQRRICFLVSDAESKEILESFSDFLSIHTLTTAKYDNLEQELPELLSLLGKQKNPVFFLDSYFVTAPYLEAVKKYAKTVYLDDLQLFDYDVDMLINYDVIPKPTLPNYEKAYTKAAKLLLGAEYTPLRTQFQNRQIQIKPDMKHVLITSGGSDPYYFCQSLIPYLVHASLPVTFHVVVGKLFTNTKELKQLAYMHPYIQLHENVTDMASLMEQCDAAVSASGTTLYELCALGIPTVSFTMADNQLIIAKAFETVNAIPYAGDIRTASAAVMEKISSFLHLMLNDAEKRKSAHDAMHRLVDGNGAARIALAVASL